MKKIFTYKPSLKVITIVLSIVFILSLLPILRFCLYTIPWFDDYNYSTYTKSFQEAYGRGVINAIRGACNMVAECHYAWQGTFSSIFFMALSGLAISDTAYFIGPIFLVLIFSLSSILCVYMILSKVLKFSPLASLSIALLSSILMIQTLYLPSHGFFWYNGGVHYVGMGSFLMLYIACVLFFNEKNGALWAILSTILLCLLSLITSGANYVTALHMGVISVLLWIYVGFKDKKKLLRLVLPTIVYIVGFAINATAPGNKVRIAYFDESSRTPVRAVLESFYYSFKDFPLYFDIALVVTMIALVPIIVKGLESSDFKFRYPAIPILFLIGFFASSYTPAIYSMGGNTLDRVLNICKICFQLMFIFSEIYLLGWAKNKLKEKNKSLKDFGFFWIYPLLLIVLVLEFKITGSNRYEYTTIGCYEDVHLGEAQFTYNQYLERIEKLKSSEQDVVFDPYVFAGWYQHTTDISTEPDAEPNESMAKWYGKHSVRLSK